MRCCFSGEMPDVFRRGFFVREVRARAAAAIILLPLAGCATSPESSGHMAAMSVAGQPVRVATAPPIELEDDGLPAQSPPRIRKRAEPDDPSEPFSPNYGTVPVGHDIEPAESDGVVDGDLAFADDVKHSAERIRAARPLTENNQVDTQKVARLPVALPSDLPPGFRAGLERALVKYE